MSFVSGTNSTVSSLRGAGRTVGSLLSASGKRVESFLNRSAERVGVGPNALVQRLLSLIQESHNQRLHLPILGGRARSSSSLSRPPLPLPEYNDLLLRVEGIAYTPCFDCGKPLLDNFPLDQVSIECLAKLVEYLKYVLTIRFYLSYNLNYVV